MTTTSKYNKSEIMKEAWEMFNTSSDMFSFGECLRMTWELAKERIVKKSLSHIFVHKTSKTYISNGCDTSTSAIYKIVDRESFNNLYKKIIDTFAKKVMMTIAKKQNGILTEKQYDVILNAAASI
jgi:PBP1b-binding outer membrane lipoprotein LpoB